MTPDEKITLSLIALQLELAMFNMEQGDLLRARERLAVVVAGLDRVCYPEHA